ncbi:MAG TPA: XRE family transcriptional regulator [Cellvibrio sp.]|nr:XRE family transcriptional regulator [Cellvibrio sp.]
MNIREYRFNRGWSQEQLAEISGLSVRTIQRIEQGQKPGLETLSALASALEIDIAKLRADNDFSPQKRSSNYKQDKIVRRSRTESRFYNHLINYCVVVFLLFVINFVLYSGYVWAVWPAIGWGVGVALHGLRAFRITDSLIKKVKNTRDRKNESNAEISGNGSRPNL